MFSIILLLSAFVLSTCAQILIQPIVSWGMVISILNNSTKLFLQAHLAHPELAHPAVVANGIWERQLPPALSKSAQFYANPRTAEFLAQESWLTDKETPVFERKAEEIDRSQVGKIFRNAGLQKKK